MTDTLQARPAGALPPRHVARSELAKIVTLRSTAITLGLTFVAALLVTGLVTNSALHHGPRSTSASTRPRSPSPA